MTDYQLAKVLQIAGGMRSRKRIQKTVHLLQCAGCDFDLDFRLHYYGPYSSALAERLDWMANNRILIETTQATEVGTQYNYELNETLSESLETYEKTPVGRVAKEEMEQFQELLEKLNDTRPRVLELASTMVAFFQVSQDWEAAQTQVADFKAEGKDSALMCEARYLAEVVVDFKDA